MKRHLTLILVALLALLVGACGAASAPAPRLPEAQSDQTTQTSGLPNQPSKSQPPAPPANGNPPATDTNAGVADRLIIKTANLSLIVKDAEAALETVKGTATTLGGFISNSQTTRINKDQVRVNVTIRVPADRYDEALKQIKQTSLRVNSEHLGGQDVTEEYTDLSARLRNLEATEKELLALLTSVREKTSKAEDILAVQRELNNVRMQIEQLKGRMQYLDRSVALATITLDLSPDSLEAPVASEGWDPARVARDATRSLVNAMQALTNLGIYLAILVLPILLIVAVPLVLVLRWLRRPRRARATTV